MPDHDQKRSAVAAAEWHLAAAEYRVFLAMRRRAQGDDTVGHEKLSHLFDELVQAIAAHKASTGADEAAAAHDQDREPGDGGPATGSSGPAEPARPMPGRFADLRND